MNKITYGLTLAVVFLFGLLLLTRIELSLTRKNIFDRDLQFSVEIETLKQKIVENSFNVQDYTHIENRLGNIQERLEDVEFLTWNVVTSLPSTDK